LIYSVAIAAFGLAMIAGCGAASAPAEPPEKGSSSAPVHVAGDPPPATEITVPVSEAIDVLGPAEDEPMADCPAKLGQVTVTEERLEIAQPIYFHIGKNAVKTESYPLLDDIAEVLRRCPAITIEVQGHTDPRGSSDYNLRLSRVRAREVVEQLVARGIDRRRLTFKGFGETCPIHVEGPDPHESWRRSRRIELIRTDGDTRYGCPPPEQPPLSGVAEEQQIAIPD
jgi:outer membrane protein OmpA-like peptidoglycan-associated protein